MAIIEILPQNLTFHNYEAMDKMRLSKYCGTTSPICVLFIVLSPKSNILKRKWLCIMFIVSFQLILHQGKVYITFIACLGTQYLILLHSTVFSTLTEFFVSFLSLFDQKQLNFSRVIGIQYVSGVFYMMTSRKYNCGYSCLSIMKSGQFSHLNVSLLSIFYPGTSIFTQKYQVNRYNMLMKYDHP